jgi:hypothetical protein
LNAKGGCHGWRQEICCLQALTNDMNDIVNLEETPGKMVGRIRERSRAEVLDRMAARLNSMGIKLPFPKGVFRFKTFEEADAWEMQHRIAAAVKRLRDRQP